MRIISQDGLYDIAYEALAIRFHEDDRAIIIGVPLSVISMDLVSDVPIIRLGEYSTEAKAQKAMEMLHDNYGRLCNVKVLASGSAKHMEESFPGNKLNEIIEEYHEMNIFRFPADGDVEV